VGHDGFELPARFSGRLAARSAMGASHASSWRTPMAFDRRHAPRRHCHRRSIQSHRGKHDTPWNNGHVGRTSRVAMHELSSRSGFSGVFVLRGSGGGCVRSGSDIRR
jgi:hypothetical protein